MTHKPITANTLFYGDNLPILRDYIPDQSVDLITLEPPTRDMAGEAAGGFYTSPGWAKTYPKIQLLTVDQRLHGAAVEMPPTEMTFKQAQRVKDQGPKQQGLFDEGRHSPHPLRERG